jgi:hypothetical protein
MREEVKESWKKLLTKELHKNYFSPLVIRIAASWKIKLARHVTVTGGKR